MKVIKMMYDPHRHGVGCEVLNTNTGKFGRVVAITETSYEWIEPQVQYDSGEIRLESASHLRVLREVTNDPNP